jgi:DNA segregation ATPase FtsK/SpoIIIE, S-DNA-T family
VSRILAADQVLEWIERLKKTIEEFAARAEKLTDEHRAKVSRERQRNTVETSALRQNLAASNTEQDTQYQQARAATQERQKRRKARLDEAYQASKEHGLEEIDKRIGTRRYDLQRRVLQAEKERDAALTKSTTSYEDFKRDLEGAQEELARSEREAQRAFRGYGSFTRGFFRAYEAVEIDGAADQSTLLSGMKEALATAVPELLGFRRFWLLGLLRLWWLWLLLLGLCGGVAPILLEQIGKGGVTYQQTLSGAAVAALAVLGLRFLAKAQAASSAAAISQTLARGRRLHDVARDKGQSHYHRELERIRTEFETTTRSADQELKQATAGAGDLRVKCRMETDQRMVRATARHEQLSRMRLQRLEERYHRTVQQRRVNEEERLQAQAQTSEERLRALAADFDSAWNALQGEWQRAVPPVFEALDESRAAVVKMFPGWDWAGWKSWIAPGEFGKAARFAELKVDFEKLCLAVPKDKRLALPSAGGFSVPLCLGYPASGSILFETAQSGHDQAVAALNGIILRLLSVAPPGRLNFTVIDPVGLGQNFAGVMHLADYEEQMINNRIWTQSTQIEQKLADLNEHMEKVIQMYLRNEYQTIAEYNDQAGVIAEKYYFLVVADFPANFSETAIKRLLSIAASGARCGVYTLIHWDTRQPSPPELIPAELRKACFCLTAKGTEFVVTGHAKPGLEVALDTPAAAEVVTDFIQRVGRQSRDSGRVEVPFEHVIPPDAELWRQDTAIELRVPIGRTGATKLQYLEIGKGTRQHGLVAGKTGSGKSTLFHVIITNLALWCSPDQVEFYLVDFKKGVEFKCYGSKRLPHARVVAIESDREFGLSVLQKVDDELRRRGDLFRQLGVQDVAGYKRAGGKESIPRTLLLIDEFQEFFVEDDKVAQTASLLLDRIVRQGRAFGIHVLLGSQTLGGAYTVARTTLGQMVIRIALQCNEADAYLIMDDTNPAPRLLSRPGEGIYNDMAGALEGNSPFQVVWLSEEIRDKYLSKARELADARPGAFPGPIVFEGNAPADVRENALLRSALADAPSAPPLGGRMWLGAPNSIKGPTEALFQRQSGNHLLLVGQRDEAVLAILSIGLLSLAAQYPAGTARFIICDASPPGSTPREYLEKVFAAIPQDKILVKPGDVSEVLKPLAEDYARRSENVEAESGPAVFLFIHGLQRFSKLRYEEDFSFSSGDAGSEVKPGAVLNDLICGGARLGFHVIATCDTYNNVSRAFSRKALSEFEMRVLFQMSANDSASLIDSPKAGMLGLHRAIFYNAQEGTLETFRPYALPPSEWVEQTARALARS